MQILLGIAVLFFAAPVHAQAVPVFSEQALSLTSPWHKQEKPGRPVIEAVREVAGAVKEVPHTSVLYRTAARFIHKKLQGFRDKNSAFNIPPTTDPVGSIDPQFRRRLERAYQLAEEAHEGQVLRDRRTPYLVHLLSTAWIYLDEFKQENEDVIILALLQDVLKDHLSIQRHQVTLSNILHRVGAGGLTLSEQDKLEKDYLVYSEKLTWARDNVQKRIELLFGESMAQNVSDLTGRVRPLEQGQSLLDIHMQKIEPHSDALLSKPREIQLLKIADRLDQLRWLFTLGDVSYRIYFLFQNQLHFLNDFVLNTTETSLNGKRLMVYRNHLSRMRDDVFTEKWTPAHEKIPLLLKNASFIQKSLQEFEELLEEAVRFGAHPSLWILATAHHQQIEVLLRDLQANALRTAA